MHMVRVYSMYAVGYADMRIWGYAQGCTGRAKALQLIF
jgi:hypothetical protein